MAIRNLLCDSCDHRFVCKKRDILRYFDNSKPSEDYIFMDITIDACLDYQNIEEGNEDVY